MASGEEEPAADDVERRVARGMWRVPRDKGQGVRRGRALSKTRRTAKDEETPRTALRSLRTTYDVACHVGKRNFFSYFQILNDSHIGPRRCRASTPRRLPAAIPAPRPLPQSPAQQSPSTLGRTDRARRLWPTAFAQTAGRREARQRRVSQHAGRRAPRPNPPSTHPPTHVPSAAVSCRLSSPHPHPPVVCSLAAAGLRTLFRVGFFRGRGQHGGVVLWVHSFWGAARCDDACGQALGGCGVPAAPGRGRRGARRVHADR